MESGGVLLKGQADSLCGHGVALKIPCLQGHAIAMLHKTTLTYPANYLIISRASARGGKRTSAENEVGGFESRL